MLAIWYSRRVLSWRLSNTIDTSFCVDALEEAFERFGQPSLFNTDQGSQFTSEDFTTPLRDRGIAIGMDGKERCLDNVFVERLWRSVKYEEVYLHAYADVTEARAGIGRYLAFHNEVRAHQALGYQTVVYIDPMTATLLVPREPDAEPSTGASLVVTFLPLLFMVPILVFLFRVLKRTQERARAHMDKMEALTERMVLLLEAKAATPPDSHSGR